MTCSAAGSGSSQTVLHMAQKGKPGTADSGYRPEMNGQNTSDHVLVDLDAEDQSNLLRNSRTSPGGIALFHLNDSIDKFSSGPFLTRFMPGSWRKKQAVFPFLQGLVEVQESGGFQDDCGIALMFDSF